MLALCAGTGCSMRIRRSQHGAETCGGTPTYCTHRLQVVKSMAGHPARPAATRELLPTPYFAARSSSRHVLTRDTAVM